VTRRERAALAALFVVGVLGLVFLLLRGDEPRPARSAGAGGSEAEPGPVPFDGRYLIVREDGVWSLGEDGAKGESAERRDLPSPESMRAVTFVAYGDSRSDPEVHSSVAEAFMRHAPAFVLHTGDLVTDGNRYEDWGPEFFRPLAGAIDAVPFAIVRGNHESLPPHFETFFLPPGAKTYYAFRWGPVLVVAAGFGREQTTAGFDEWLDETLARAWDAPWKVFTRHMPLVSALGRRTCDVRALRRWAPVFERRGVDLVLTGHDHFYARSAPLCETEGGRGVVYVTTAGGGAPLYEGGEHPWIESYRRAHHHCVVSADASRLELRAVDLYGAVLDRLVLDKSAPPTGEPWRNHLAGE
jgi:hypothetical protein